MVKVCNDYFMIDALAGGQVVRKRKYRRENTMIGYKWYDYNGVEVTDPIEISRLDGLATKHQRVDEAYDDHAIFMSSTNYVNSVSGIPMDKHMVVVEWRPDSEQGFVTMAHDEGLDGDSYYIVVINAGDEQATIYTPVDPEDPKDGTSRAVDGDNVSVGGSYVSISPKQVERIRATFRDGKRKFPSMWPNLEILYLAGGRVRLYPKEWLSFNNLKELYLSPGYATSSFDPNTCPAMDEVDKINSSLKIFDHINRWYGSVVSWHPYMSGKGLGNIERIDASHSYSNIDVSNLPDYIYEMRSMNSFYMYRSLSTQVRCDTFISTLYERVMGFDYLTMSSSASDGKRNQFYGLYLSMYLASYPDDKRPSGVLQAPSGFIKGQSNGSPSTPMEMVYVLMNNYGWRFSMAPEASVLRSIRSSDIDTRSYKPYKLIVFDDGRTFVGNGDVLAHDTDKVLSFGGQPEGEYLCDSMGLDRNVIAEYFNKIGNG